MPIIQSWYQIFTSILSHKPEKLNPANLDYNGKAKGSLNLWEYWKVSFRQKQKTKHLRHNQDLATGTIYIK